MDPQRTNQFGQPIGPALPGWTAPPLPSRAPLIGRWCRLEPLDPARHAAALAEALMPTVDDPRWTYLPYGPFADRAAHDAWLANMAATTDTLFFTIVTSAGPGGRDRIGGLAAWLRIFPAMGSIEIGHLHFAPALQRSAAATETLFLLFDTAFALGYRRCEWKCDTLNLPSRAAAQRLGLSFEGVFRHATVYKGRSRDTAWYAATDTDWPGLRAAFMRWLAPENFTDGQQRTRLSDLTAPLLRARG